MDNTIAFYEAVIIFAVTYIGIIFDKIPRTICALMGGGMMIYFHHVICRKNMPALVLPSNLSARLRPV